MLIFTVQVLHKSSISAQSQRTIVPTHIPYMVSLVKFFETDSAIYLVLQHAAGGTLWNYVSSYFGQFVQDSGQDLGLEICGDLHEKQLRSAGRKAHHQPVPKTNTVANEICDIKRKSKSDTFESNVDRKDLRTVNGMDTTSDSFSLASDAPTELSLDSKDVENVRSDDERDDDSAKVSCFASKLESSKHDLCTENETDIGELDDVDRNQDFKSILESCKSDINSYSICSFDSDNATLSRLTSVSSDHTEPVAIGETNVQSFPPLSEGHSEVTETTSSFNSNCSGKSKTATTASIGSAPLPVCHDSSEVPALKPKTADISKHKCNLNLPLNISTSSTTTVGSLTPTVQQSQASKSGFREPLKSPSMSRLSCGEKGSNTANGGHRRCRTLSSVFAELDLASDVPSEIRHVTQLPEGCIRQWAAEMVVAISRLHCLGIICRLAFELLYYSFIHIEIYIAPFQENL